MIDPKEIPLKEVLESVLIYMQETKSAVKRAGQGYPPDLEQCVKYQIVVLEHNKGA